MSKFAYPLAALSAALIATAGSAQMADMPPPPPPADAPPPMDAPAPRAMSGTMDADLPAWSGLYGGIHGGYGFDGGHSIPDQGYTANNLTALSTGIRPTVLKESRSGWLGGGQLGINFQRDHIVFGAEGDFSYMHSRGYATYRGNGVPGVALPGRRTFLKTRMDWLGSARARIGYAPSNRGLVYATGGYAFGKVRGSAEFDGDSDAVVNYAGSHKYTAQGWIAGGGLEFRPFTEGALSRVSVALEGTYYDLGRSNLYAIQTSTQPGYYRLGLATRGANAALKLNYAF